MLDGLFEVILAPIFELIFYLVFELIFIHVLWLVLEPFCWLTGSLLILFLSVGYVRPSTQRREQNKSYSSLFWTSYEKGKYYLDRELVSGIGVLFWILFPVILFSLNY